MNPNEQVKTNTNLLQNWLWYQKPHRALDPGRLTLTSLILFSSDWGANTATPVPPAKLKGMVAPAQYSLVRVECMCVCDFGPGVPSEFISSAWAAPEPTMSMASSSHRQVTRVGTAWKMPGPSCRCSAERRLWEAEADPCCTAQDEQNHGFMHYGPWNNIRTALCSFGGRSHMASVVACLDWMWTHGMSSLTRRPDRPFGRGPC